MELGILWYSFAKSMRVKMCVLCLLCVSNFHWIERNSNNCAFGSLLHKNINEPESVESHSNSERKHNTTSEAKCSMLNHVDRIDQLTKCQLVVGVPWTVETIDREAIPSQNACVRRCLINFCKQSIASPCRVSPTPITHSSLRLRQGKWQIVSRKN